MVIEKTPFRKYTLEENPQDIISIKHNINDRDRLTQFKKLIHQDKDSTAYKQAVNIALKVILEDKTLTVLETVLNNYRRNERLGIVEYKLDFEEKMSKSKTEITE